MIVCFIESLMVIFMYERGVRNYVPGAVHERIGVYVHISIYIIYLYIYGRSEKAHKTYRNQ